MYFLKLTWNFLWYSVNRFSCSWGKGSDGWYVNEYLDLSEYGVNIPVSSFVLIACKNTFVIKKFPSSASVLTSLV